MSDSNSNSGSTSSKKPKLPTVADETQSVDPSSDSESSSGSSRSESGDSAPNSGNASNHGGNSNTDMVTRDTPSSGNDQWDENQTDLESESKSTGDEGNETSDPDAKFKSTSEAVALPLPPTEESQVFATPGQVIAVKATSSSPAAARNTTGKAAAKLPTPAKLEASPSIITPAKSLTFEANSTPETEPGLGQLKALPAARPPVGQPPPSTVAQSLPIDTLAGTDTPSAPSKVSADPSNTTRKSDKTTGDGNKKRKAKKAPTTDPVTPQQPPKPPKQPVAAKTEPAQHQKHSKKAVKDRSAVKVSKDKAPSKAPVKRRKTPKETKPAKKSRKAERRPTSEESESSESSPDRPSTSSRIAKIPDGRRYRQLAISKAKQLGNIRDWAPRTKCVSEALRTIDSTTFDIQPTHSYLHYHKVFGTGLPHVEALYENYRQRYGVFLGEATKLQLQLTCSQEQSTVALVQPDPASQFASLWQFDNDLLRTPQDQAARKPVSQGGSTTPKVDVIAIDFKDIAGLQTASPVASTTKSSTVPFTPSAATKRSHGDSSGRNKEVKKKRKKSKKEVMHHKYYNPLYVHVCRIFQ